MLRELTLEGDRDMIALAITRLREFEPPKGYHLAFSGGKDSVTILRLAEMAGVRFDAHYQLTTVDPPELVWFIRRDYPHVQIHRPEKSMWQLVETHRLPPLRNMRYCCRELKEVGGNERFIITGIRWAESRYRAKRRMVESCLKTRQHKQFLHPIIDWSTDQVWEFIRQEHIPYCSLYDEGFRRLGCVMCPNGGPTGMARDSMRWPKIAEAWRRACRRAYARRVECGEEMTWASGDEIYEWWLSCGSDQRIEDAQIVLFED